MLGRSSSFTRRTRSKTLHLSLITAMLTVALGTATAQPIQAELADPSGTVSPEGLLNSDGTLDLSTGFEGVLDVSGWQVALDDERGPVLRAASSSATSPVAGWHSLSNQGLSHYVVFALAVMGSNLYVGGEFTQTADGAVTNLGNIARYNTTTATWHALPNQGLDEAVRALAVVGSDLYVGGNFTKTGDGSLTKLGRIARYDTAAGTWHALPKQGLDSVVWALALSGDDLYVGGRELTETGDGSLTNLGRIARYDTAAGTWHALSNQGLNWYVFKLEVVGNDLYVGGLFTQTGDGSLTNLGHIARYNTTTGTWHALPKQGLDNGVYALSISGSTLHVGGYFSQTGDGTKDLNHVARYNTANTSWHALPNGGLDSLVRSIVAVGDDLYMSGQFTQTGDGSLTDLGRIARYDTAATTWHALPNEGFNSWVNALAVSGSDLYVAGYFNITGDRSRLLGHIARYSACHKALLPLVMR